VDYYETVQLLAALQVRFLCDPSCCFAGLQPPPPLRRRLPSTERSPACLSTSSQPTRNGSPT
jgi:hypothetical protein